MHRANLCILHGGLLCITFCPPVCPSVTLPLDNNSYLHKYYSYESETSPQHKDFLCASWKNTNYTLRSIFSVNGQIRRTSDWTINLISGSVIAIRLKLQHIIQPFEVHLLTLSEVYIPSTGELGKIRVEYNSYSRECYSYESETKRSVVLG